MALSDIVTFALAMAGYAGLAVTAIRAGYGAVPLVFWRLTASVIVLHTLLVWQVRYDWDIAVATRNGYSGFVLFHTALVAIVWSAFAAEPARSRLIWACFGVVSVGALGAVFRYDVVAPYRLPVILVAAAGVAALGLAWRRRHRAAPDFR